MYKLIIILTTLLITSCATKTSFDYRCGNTGTKRWHYVEKNTKDIIEIKQQVDSETLHVPSVSEGLWYSDLKGNYAFCIAPKKITKGVSRNCFAAVTYFEKTNDTWVDTHQSIVLCGYH